MKILPLNEEDIPGLHKLEIEKNSYRLAFPAPFGTGIIFRFVGDGAAVVDGFKPLSNGQPGQPQNSGLVHIGDILIAVDDMIFADISIAERGSLIGKLEKYGQVAVVSAI